MISKVNVALDVADLAASEAFWSEALGYERRGNVEQYVALKPRDDAPGPHLLLQEVADARSGRPRPP